MTAVPPPDPIARLREQLELEDDSDIPPDVRRALMDCAVHNQRISYYYLCGVYRLGREQAEARVDRLTAALRAVHDTFVKDEAQGYQSRDRQFAIEILGAALAPADPEPKP